ncbi:hypothetical protein [Hydrogenophaga taeniospiralis]|uniref:hypothetical protein n=2 Tax=Hydrogenophaga taeniospiralis TaxID=65656 RepID=UPI002435D87B|nr:hypothetical protein [Hydrogenophaga taeniospiralis]
MSGELPIEEGDTTMREQTGRYKGGLLGFLGELRWIFGGAVGLVVVVMTAPETNSVELGFLGLSLWIHFFLGAASAILVVMFLRTIGMNPDDETDGND